MVEKEKSRITPKSLPDFTCRRGKEVGLGGDFCLLDTQVPLRHLKVNSVWNLWSGPS